MRPTSTVSGLRPKAPEDDDGIQTILRHCDEEDFTEERLAAARDSHDKDAGKDKEEQLERDEGDRRVPREMCKDVVM